MEADKHRFRFYLSVLKMLKLMVADGMYAPDYILPPAEGEGRPSEAKSKSGRARGVSERSTPRGGGSEASMSMARRPSIAAETVAEVTTRAVPVRELELLLLRVLYRSEPQVFLDEPDKSKKDVVRLLRQFYTKSTEADVIVVEAKVEVCLILQLLYDMYTDHRVKALVARCSRHTILGHAQTPHLPPHTSPPHLPLQVQGAVRHSRREQAVAEGGATEVRGVAAVRQARRRPRAPKVPRRRVPRPAGGERGRRPADHLRQRLRTDLPQRPQARARRARARVWRRGTRRCVRLGHAPHPTPHTHISLCRRRATAPTSRASDEPHAVR